MYGGGDVEAVANDVDDERIGNRFLDQWKTEQVPRRMFGPAVNALLAGDGLHYDAKEVARVAAICHHTLFDFVGV